MFLHYYFSNKNRINHIFLTLLSNFSFFFLYNKNVGNKNFGTKNTESAISDFLNHLNNFGIFFILGKIEQKILDGTIE